MKKSDVYALITPQEMFTMIEDFADGLQEYMRERYSETVKQSIMNDVAEDILHILRDSGLEGRVGMIMLLHIAAAMYQAALEHDNARCPNTLLN